MNSDYLYDDIRKFVKYNNDIVAMNIEPYFLEIHQKYIWIKLYDV